MKRLWAVIAALVVALGPFVALCEDVDPLYTSRRLPTAYNESFYPSDYSTLAAWEDATDYDLTDVAHGGEGATGEVLTVSGGVHDDKVILQGATVDDDYFRVIRAAPGAVAIFRPSSPPASGDTVGVFSINGEAYSSFYDLRVDGASIPSTAAGIAGFHIHTGNANRITGCHVYGIVTSAAGHFAFWNSYCGNIIYTNCVAHHIGVSGLSHGFVCHSSVGAARNYFYNCTVSYVTRGFVIQAANGTAKNCLADHVTYGFLTGLTSTSEGGTWDKTTCYGPNNNTMFRLNFAGTLELMDTPHYLEDLGRVDLRLSFKDTTCREEGTDLSAEPDIGVSIPVNFDDDFNGQARPYDAEDGGLWDIGADEGYPSGGGWCIMGIF